MDLLSKDFWSIERVVAFIVAPVATPLSGACALWLAKHFPGVHTSGPAIYAFASAAALSTAAALIKWLDGRQKFVGTADELLGRVQGHLTPLVASIPDSEKQALLAGIEGIVSGHVAKLAGVVAAPSEGPPTVQAGGDWPVPGDPAPDGLEDAPDPAPEPDGPDGEPVSEA